MGTSHETSFPREWVDAQLQVALDEVAADTDGVEALFRGQEGSFLRLAEAHIVQASRTTEGRITVRAVVQGRAARATTGDLTSDGLRRCARTAASRARDAPVGGQLVTLPPPAPLPDAHPRSLDPATARLDAGTKAAWLAEALRAHRSDDLALAGRFHTGLATLAVRSSTGVAAYHQGSWSDLSLSALERPAGHRASACRQRADVLVDEATVDAMQREVRDECLRARDPVTVAPGEWDVVIAPAAVTELLEWLGMIAFGSRAADDGLSFSHARVGEQVTGGAITVIDDASMPYGVGVPMPFDVEGQPKQAVKLLDAGVARGLVHDSATGPRYGCAGTGHAQLDDNFPTSGSAASHLHVLPGTATPEQLIGQVDHGLFITRFHYVNAMMDPRKAVMTGLLRDGAFLIQGGQLGQAVETLRFTESMLEAFARIPGAGGISRELEPHASWFGSDRCTVAPWLLIPRLKFTSGR